jgi:hypothetical protein
MDPIENFLLLLRVQSMMGATFFAALGFWWITGNIKEAAVGVWWAYALAFLTSILAVISLAAFLAWALCLYSFGSLRSNHKAFMDDVRLLVACISGEATLEEFKKFIRLRQAERYEWVASKLKELAKAGEGSLEQFETLFYAAKRLGVVEGGFEPFFKS